MFGGRVIAFYNGRKSDLRKLGIFGQRGILFYPLILATYPFAFTYAANSGEAFIEHVIVSLAVFLAATILGILLLRLFVKDNAKVAMAVSILLVLFFSYAIIRKVLVRTYRSIAGPGHFVEWEPYLSLILVVIAIISVGAVIKYRANWVPLIRFGTLLALLMVLFDVGFVILDNWASSAGQPAGGQSFFATSVARPNVDELPDIYYIILDSYGRADVLEERFAFDNSEFIDSLTRKGFFVAPESRSNYPLASELSIAAALTMRYMEIGENPNPLVEENAVARLAKTIGYQYVHVGSGWYLTNRNRHADVEYSDGNLLRLLWSDFSLALLKDTIALPLATPFGVDLTLELLQNHAKHFIDSTRWLQEIPDIEGPTFTFSHIYPPHPPFVFHRDGTLRSDAALPHEDDNQRYIDQLIYVNQAIDSVVEDILNRSATEPIIIIHGDHGPPPSRPFDAAYPRDNLDMVLERSAILNAYYLPEYCRSNSGLYPNISPVNTFRFVFSRCLGAEFDLLPDETFWTHGGPGGRESPGGRDRG